jgi:hypothetical protein
MKLDGAAGHGAQSFAAYLSHIPPLAGSPIGRMDLMFLVFIIAAQPALLVNNKDVDSWSQQADPRDLTALGVDGTWWFGRLLAWIIRTLGEPYLSSMPLSLLFEAVL